jgi:toxin ParE1/3/4
MSSCLVSPEASRDLEAIHDHIAQHRPQAAARLIRTFESQFRALVRFPEMGTACPELSPDLGCFPVRNYVIFYRQTADGIQIVRVLNGRRDSRFLFEDPPGG